MLVTCITHADARDKKKYTFRGLTEQGWQEVNRAAERFRNLIAVLETDEDEGIPIVETVVSSPKARCLETAILFARAISEFRLIATSEIKVNSGLKEGWFTTRPVLFAIDYKVGEPWDKGRVLFCEGYIDEEWQGLIRT